MSAEAFIIAAARGKDASEAIRRAVDAAGIKPNRVEDLLVVMESTASEAEAERLAEAAGLSGPAVCISAALRAMVFGAESILSGDVEVVVVLEAAELGAAAVVLTGAEAIGRWNLMPRARLAGRSLAGAEAAMRRAGIASADLQVTQDGDSLLHFVETLDELERRQGHWGLVQADPLALVIERI